MADQHSTDVKLEIGHVLFIDIVGYSKLLITEQRELLRRLTDIVRQTEPFRSAEAQGNLVRIPTGDGMALVFRDSPESPARCGLELASKLLEHPDLRVRMGIHSGPVSEIDDVSDRVNVTGAGINVAQRVMDCGDAGHILLSKHVADDLEQFPQWRPLLHDLGECEVKHGVRLHLINLYSDAAGNPAVPEKIKCATADRVPQAADLTRSRRLQWSLIGAAVLVLLAMVLLAIHKIGTDHWTAQSKARTQEPANAASPSAPQKSIAVLPFDNLSRDPENAFFADGVQDEILTDLSKIADLKVISRSSVMHYKTGVERNLRKIGQELGVAHLLEGSVQRSGNRVRVNAQLIDARNDAHLWAQTYDRDLADVFAIQSEIAKTIADQLQAKLSPSEQNAITRAPTQDLGAFDLYTRARNLMLNVSFTNVGGENLRQAVDLLQKAITRDPNFAAAYVSMAEAHEQLYAVQGDHTEARLALAEAAVARLRELRPDAGETHLAMARHQYFASRDYAAARAELNAAASSLPNEPAILALSAFIDRRAGKWDESVYELSQAIERDPRNTFFMQQQSLTYGLLRRYAEMAAILDRALGVDPDAVETRIARAQAEFQWRANTQPLHDAINNAVAHDPASGPIAADNWINLACCERDQDALSRAVAALGNRRFSFVASLVTFNSHFGDALNSYLRKDSAAFKKALLRARGEQEEFIRQQPGYAPAICTLGLIDAMLGNKEDALKEGRRATELIPVTKDALTGAELIGFFTGICAWSGEKDLALEQLAIATRNPSFVSYGHLKLHPMWDPLRGDARFEQIIVSLAPKE
jgi:Predicted integral membrane protein